jgi:hypothetical protein
LRLNEDATIVTAMMVAVAVGLRGTYKTPYRWVSPINAIIMLATFFWYEVTSMRWSFRGESADDPVLVWVHF